MGETLAAIKISQCLTALYVGRDIFRIAGRYDVRWFDHCEIYYLCRIGRIAIATASNNGHSPPQIWIVSKEEVLSSFHNCVDLASVLANKAINCDTSIYRVTRTLVGSCKPRFNVRCPRGTIEIRGPTCILVSIRFLIRVLHLYFDVMLYRVTGVSSAKSCPYRNWNGWLTRNRRHRADAYILSS